MSSVAHPYFACNGRPNFIMMSGLFYLQQYCRYSPRQVKESDVSRLMHVVNTRSMAHDDTDSFCKTYLMYDFGVHDLLRNIHNRLGIEENEVAKDPPAKFYCPISLKIMTEPVRCHEGHNFERSEIESWLEADTRCPVSRHPLRCEQLVPSDDLLKSIVEYRGSGPNLHAQRQIPDGVPPIPDALRVAVNAARRQGRRLDRKVALMGVVSTGKSSLQKALYFENAFPLPESVDLTDADAIVEATGIRFDHANASTTFRDIAIHENSGTTTSATAIPLTPPSLTDEAIIGHWDLVDSPGLSLNRDHHKQNAQQEREVVTAEEIMEVIDNQFRELDAVIVVLNTTSEPQLYDVCKRAISALRAKNKLEPGSARWHSAVNRLFVVRTKADSFMDDEDLVRISDVTTWFRNRDPDAQNTRINKYIDHVASGLTEALNELEVEMAAKHK